MNAQNDYVPTSERDLCATRRCACETNGRPIQFHVSAHDAKGSYLPERICHDMDMYADCKTLDDARARAAEWFSSDARVVYASIRESHQPTEGLSWVVGPHVEQIGRPGEDDDQPGGANESSDRAGDDEEYYEPVVGPWVRDLRKIREDMDDHMSVIDDECAESEPDVSAIELETRSLLVEAQKMLDAVLALQAG